MIEPLTYPSFVSTDADKKAYDVGRVGGWREWIRNHTDLRAIEKGCYFSIAKAKYTRRCIETILYFAPKKPFVLLEYQWRDIIGPIFGWCRPNGRRRFSQAYIEIPKGHGKTLVAAAIGLYMLVMDGRHRAECYAAAVDRVQGTGIFNEAANLVINSPILKKQLKLSGRDKKITVTGKNSSVPLGLLRSLSKAANNQGLSHTHCMVFEELHTFRDREAYGSLRYATSKVELNNDHDTPLIFSITTAGGDLTGVGYEEHEYARRLLAGELPETPTDYYAVIYSVPDDADVFDLEVVKKANPGWGLTIDSVMAASDMAKAKISKTDEIIWRRYRCNQWVGGSEKPWIPVNLWRDDCTLPFPLDELVGRPAYYALDLSATSDMTSLSILIPEMDGSFHVIPYFWVPEQTAEEKQRQNRLTPYQVWGDTKHPILNDEQLLTLVPGNVIDYDVMHAKVLELAKLFPVKQIAIDNKFNGQPEINRFVAEGYDVVPFFGGLGVPCINFEKIVRAKKLRHRNNPILNWMLSNVRITVDDKGWMKPDKKKSTGKIDGIITILMALACASYGTHAEPGVFIPK